MKNSKAKFSFEKNVFDIIRYYAMFQVMIIHTVEHFKLQLPGILANIFKFPGVVILFSLSGYLTTASLDRNSKNGDTDKKIFIKNLLLHHLCPPFVIEIFEISLAVAFSFFLSSITRNIIQQIFVIRTV